MQDVKLTTTRLMLLLLLLSGAIFLLLYSGVLFFRGEEVWADSGKVRLHGELVLPRWGQGPFPAAVIVHGSGPSTWQEMRGYARRLVPLGMAVLIYDKRGVGESTGTYRSIGVSRSESLLGELASDASTWVDFLLRHPEVDADRIGLIGGSQAGWIMPLAAHRNPRIRYFVAISGPAVSCGAEIYFSQLTGDDPGPYRELQLSNQEIRSRLAGFRGPHGYDPVPVLSELEIPGLWLLGGMDRSVPTFATVSNLQRIMASSAVDYEIKEYPAGDHSLRNAQNGASIDYWRDLRAWLRRKGFVAN